ncbi:MAG: hypothetical protein HY332_21500 [Chloroflexi bacterium]|nr:hypothetical protein [Chloroflexota bacterium]
MRYRSESWGVDVRDDIAQEWTRPDGTVDDVLAGLHEVRRRIAEETAHLSAPEKAAYYRALAEQVRRSPSSSSQPTTTPVSAA